MKIDLTPDELAFIELAAPSMTPEEFARVAMLAVSERWLTARVEDLRSIPGSEAAIERIETAVDAMVAIGLPAID